MFHFSILTLFLFYLSRFIYLSHSLNNGLSIELIHRDSSKSPIYQPTETKFQRVYNAVHGSINRANHFTKQLSLNTNNPVSMVTPDAGEYFISYSVGTPSFKAYGFMDTGSSLIWLQCQPCTTCFNQTSPIFNPSKSSSYKNIRCSSKTCTHAEDMHTSCSYSVDDCEYSIIYDDNFKSQGDLSLETLTLDSTLGSSVSFPNFVIGCGHINKFPYTDQNSGIVGLGNGPMSLIKQLGSSIDGKFSYCLIPVYDESDHSNSSNKLNFGDAAVVTGEGVVSTPIVKSKGPSKGAYLLTLEAFSVGNKRIEYEGYEIEGTNASTRNIIIDSGTPMTLLPHDFYSSLESTVVKVVKLPRVELPGYQFRLCYNTSTLEQSNIFPIITVHFSGGDVKVNYNSTFIPIKKGIMCFTFLPFQGPVIFGTFAQHNLLVGYDLNKSIISFKPIDCTKY
jgi:hypothetical protein